jgi:hypothetical protein
MWRCSRESTTSVFFSHSKHDRNLINYFSNIFTDIGLQGIFFEWQKPYSNYAGRTISNIICDPDSAAIFVLLGKYLENPPVSSSQYTHNWVNFEVGVAAGCGKRIWVFEEFGSSVRFPVPFVTDYAQFTHDSVDHLQYYGRIFRSIIMYRTNLVAPVPWFRCQYIDCNAIYNCWSIAQRFNCPVCRRPIPKRSGGPTQPFVFPSNVV